MESKTISGLAYMLYKEDWMRRISFDRKSDLLKTWYEETKVSNRNVYPPEKYLEENGFDGELYACYEEFLENEYQDEKYVKALLDNPYLIKEYFADLSFKCFQSCEDIADSLELSSGTTICTMMFDGKEASIEVRGEVKIWFNPNGIGNGQDRIYRDITEMPDELKTMIHDGDYVDSENVHIDDNNWFEVFYDTQSLCVDCEYASKENLKEIMFDFIKQCLED